MRWPLAGRCMDARRVLRGTNLARSRVRPHPHQAMRLHLPGLPPWRLAVRAHALAVRWRGTRSLATEAHLRSLTGKELRQLIDTQGLNVPKSQKKSDLVSGVRTTC